MNKLLEVIIFNTMYAGLERSDFRVQDIKEHVCGDPRVIEETPRLYTDYNELREDLLANVTVPYEIHECILDNGNIMFALTMYIKGTPFVAIPLRSAQNGTIDLCVPEDISACQTCGYKVVRSNEWDEYISELDTEEKKEALLSSKEIFQNIRKAEDESVRFIDNETYTQKFKEKTGEEIDAEELTKDTNVGIAMNQMSNGRYGVMRYSTALGKIDILDIDHDNDGVYNDILLACNSKSKNVNVLECAKNDILEEFFIADKTSLTRKIKSIYIQESVARTLKKNTVDKVNSVKVERGIDKATNLEDNAHEVAALPVKASQDIKGINRRIRGLIAHVKRANDDDLREKVYNDEFVPIFDDFFELFLSVGVTYGVVALNIMNPLMGMLLGVATFIVSHWKQVIDRRRINEMLDDKIALLEEEIEDARNENDFATKRQLIQIKKQLERRRAKMIAGGSKAAR